MKAMMIIDALICKPSFISQLLISLFVGLMLAIGFENLYMIVPTVACTAAITSMFNLIALDESNDWEAYRLSLPLSRTQIIQGRYGSTLMITLAYTLVGLVVFLLLVVVIVGVGPLSPFAQALLDQVAEITWQGVAIMIAFPFCFMLLFAAVVYPLVARFGLTKGIRWLPMVLVLLPLLAGLTSYFGINPIATGESSPPSMLTSFLAWMSTPAGTASVLLIALGVSALLFAASYFMAAKLYQRREF